MQSFLLLSMASLLTSVSAFIYGTYRIDFKSYGGNSVGTCCGELSHGGKAYKLVTAKDTSQWSCMTNCTYELTSKPGSRYCFQEGDINGGGKHTHCGEALALSSGTGTFCSAEVMYTGRNTIGIRRTSSYIDCKLVCKIFGPCFYWSWGPTLGTCNLFDAEPPTLIEAPGWWSGRYDCDEL